MASNVMEVTTGNVSSCPELCQLGFDVDFWNRSVRTFAGLWTMIIHAVAGEEKQVEQIIHALGVLLGNRKK